MMEDEVEASVGSGQKEYSDRYRGFVKITVRLTDRSSLAYQVPIARDDAQLYLLGIEDFGKVVLMSLVLDNCDISMIDIELFQEISKVSNVSQIPNTMLTSLLPILSGSSVPVPLNPDNWALILDGRYAKCCPRVECSQCKFKRLVTPRLMLKHHSDMSFTCKNMGLTCFSFIQTEPCNVLRLEEVPKSIEKKVESMEDFEINIKNQGSSMISRHPSSSQPLFESSISSSKSFGTLLSPSDAFNRGPRPDKVQYAVSTLNEREEYNMLVKQNPNVFGIHALGKLATSDQAPKYNADKSISAWVTWKSAWEGLFAKYGVSNPIAQAQVAMLSLKGEALDWWNARWQTHPDPHITWDGLTTLLKATFYPLDAQDNAFTAWNGLEFKGNVSSFFSEVRKTFRIYPISMEHLLSILSFRLGKGFSRKVKTRLASGVRDELSIYELEAIADELLTFDKVIPSSRTASNPVVSHKNIDSSTRTLMSHSSPSTSKSGVVSSSSTPSKSVIFSSSTASKDRDSKTVKPSSEKRKIAAVDASSSVSKVRKCFICEDRDHFCYRCPYRKLEGCCICGEDHVWQGCPLLEGKFVRKQDAACVDTDLSKDVDDLQLDDMMDNEAAELAVPDICWQTHEPLYLSSIEWNEANLPIRLSCMHTPSFSRRLVYRCKVQDRSARCLFDNGANCCLMSLSWADKHDIPRRPVNNVVKTAVQDKKVSNLMSLPVKFELGDFCTVWEFGILPDLSHDIFLEQIFRCGIV